MARLTCLLRSMQGRYFVESVVALYCTATVMGLTQRGGALSRCTKPPASQVATVERSSAIFVVADLLFGST
jgi:hypothetical protein